MATQDFSRADVRRILKIPERSLKSWEKHGLYESSGSFAFPDLAQYPNVAALNRDLHVDDILPHIQPEEMSNRGLMGSYFLAVSDSYDRRRK